MEKETIAKEYISKKLCQQFELSNGGKVIVIQNNFDVSVNTQTELVTLFPRSIITQNSELKEVLEEKSLLKDKNHLITLDDFKFLNFNSEVSSFCFPLEMKLPVGTLKIDQKYKIPQMYCIISESRILKKNKNMNFK